MEKLITREHDFGSKLRQGSVVNRLREYILWQRALTANPVSLSPPDFAPLSINLDLTLACNFSCPHCVDSAILNRGASLRGDDVKRMIDVLCEKGLLSVILLGGGEPTLHRQFREIVNYIKERRLQVGIVTNGTRLDKIAEVNGKLEGKDWVRISIDAAEEKTFKDLHQPKTGVTLRQILREAKRIKEVNPGVSMGYSFVIVWDGLEVKGHRLAPNIGEMADAVKLARDHSFDYISFKPCLIRLEDSQQESLLHQVDNRREEEIVEKIGTQLEAARKVADGSLKILESLNLKAMLKGETARIKRQPRRCHMSFFRTVVTPSGIFHCPAFRGVGRAKVAEQDGYVTREKFDESLKRTARSIMTFDAEAECDAVGCFYHDTNWWLEELTRSKKDVDEIPAIEDDNFFL
jgi:wyosine [tRNA(Phe)-imidazoG37] synthetase (radical SAM superfamily)